MMAEQTEKANNCDVKLCCLPAGCLKGPSGEISKSETDIVRVICNNEICTISQWMHGDCFRQWEEKIIAFVKSSGRARGWSDKQRLQNIWTKKGYDLAFKACDCKCGKGHLKKDLDWPGGTNNSNKLSSPVLLDDKKGKKNRNKKQISEKSDNVRIPLRVRTTSMCSSTGSGPSSEEIQLPITVGSRGHEFFATAEQAAAGNIFGHRSNFHPFLTLPLFQQNPYQIKVEDEGPHGNDETRMFILTALSSHRMTCVPCAVCGTQMHVYDKYPLVNGTFFLSPILHEPIAYAGCLKKEKTGFLTVSDKRRFHLNAVCMACLNGGQYDKNSVCGIQSTSKRLKCVGCGQFWCGGTYIIGTMYSFDIFAAAASCCLMRTSCKSCSQPLINSSPRPFSNYTRLIMCTNCGVEDYHFVRQLQDVYTCEEIQESSGGINSLILRQVTVASIQ